MELKLFSVLKKRGSCSTLLTLDISASSLLSAMLFPMLFSCQPMITWLAEATAWPSCCRSFLTQLNHFCFVIPVLLRMHVLTVKTSYEHRCNYFVYKKKQWPLKDKQNTSTSLQDHSSQLFIISLLSEQQYLGPLSPAKQNINYKYVFTRKRKRRG